MNNDKTQWVIKIVGEKREGFVLPWETPAYVVVFDPEASTWAQQLQWSTDIARAKLYPSKAHAEEEYTRARGGAAQAAAPVRPLADRLAVEFRCVDCEPQNGNGT